MYSTNWTIMYYVFQKYNYIAIQNLYLLTWESHYEIPSTDFFNPLNMFEGTSITLHEL